MLKLRVNHSMIVSANVPLLGNTAEGFRVESIIMCATYSQIVEGKTHPCAHSNLYTGNDWEHRR